MRHLFFTGESGAGKTTLLNRLLPPDMIPCGFRTERVRTERGALVYLHDPATERRYGPANCVGSLRDGVLRSRSEIFETLGVSLLLRLPPGRPIIMDELGVLEEDAPAFCRRVLELLDGGRRILGVVKDRRSGFLDAVRNHPNIEVVLVTRDNREVLFDRLKNS